MIRSPNTSHTHPGLLAKIVTTLDVLSQGRAQLGIGASWYEREQLALGVPVVPMAERFERLEETLQIKKTAVYMDPILGNTDTFLAAAEQYAALGIQELDLMPDRNPLEFTEQVAELVARVAAI
jgi:alkanesulfonate monooxygenase SsuD/methylene tetrahydromethanopterin reductase-like flavin-dependent oxidoreductase (luciferase family)